MAHSERPLPEPDDLTRFYWEHARQHQLAILRCDDCGAFVHPPRPLCRACLSEDLAPHVMSGRGFVHSHTLTHYVFHPAFADAVPYPVALVELEEDPGIRIVSNLVEIDATHIRSGLPVEVVFEDVTEEISLPMFRPREAAPA
jgi:uncharacterized OB-fold protein